jgi:hypothetical protein
LEKYGVIKNSQIKRFTIFALLSCGDADHNIKIEINTRELTPNINEQYEMREYLGITMLAAKKDYLFAGKLAALTVRKETATRDVYDIHFFAKNNWDINDEIIKLRTDKTVKKYLLDCAAYIEKIKDSRILQGLGELVGGEKEKNWIRNYLKKETIFLLKNYASVLK